MSVTLKLLTVVTGYNLYC